MKKALFIGGTGTISAAITRLVSKDPEWELFLLNRGNRTSTVPEGVKLIQADIKNEEDVSAKLQGMHFDCVCDFIAFHVSDVERDWRIFSGKTEQYIFISSASAYQKPVTNHVITEETPLSNPYWLYSREKAACEEYLMARFSEGYPVTIVRPSHTYDERKLPLGVHGDKGSWQIAKRMLEGKPVIIHGDGSSLWTLTHNSDFAVGFKGLMGNPKALGEAFHITSDESLSWDQIYKCIADALGVELKACHVSSDFLIATGRYDLTGTLLGDKACSVVFDNSKLKRLVPEFNPSIRYSEGARMTVEHILQHPELQQEDPEFDKWCDEVILAQEKAKECFKTIQP